MQRALRIVGLVLSVLIAMLVLLAGALLALGNTAPGRRLIESGTERFSAGTVLLSGLSGRFPDQLQLSSLTLRDPQGVWLTAAGLQLRWSPLQLLGRRATVQLLRAERISIERAPHYPPKPPRKSGLWLHGVSLDQLELQRLELGAPLAGNAVALQVLGSARMQSWQQAELQLRALRLDAVPSTYRAAAHLDAARIELQLDLEEGADGPLTHLAQVPGLGALSIHLQAAGPRDAVGVQLDAHAGALQAAVNGTLNLPARAGAIDVALDSPAMSLRPGVSWQRASLHGRWRGPLAAPQTSAQLELAGLLAGPVQLQTLQGELHGDGDALVLDATLGGVVLPKPALGLLQNSPLLLHVQAQLGEPARPVQFGLTHALLRARGTVHATTDGAATLAATIADLRPFAALVGQDLKGQGSLQAQLTGSSEKRQLTLAGDIDVSGGSAPLAALLAPHTNFNARLALAPDSVEFQRSELTSSHLQASVQGDVRHGIVDLSWKLALPDVAALATTLTGKLNAQGRVQGSAPRLTLAAAADGLLAVHGSAPGQLRLTLQLHDLPQRPSGRIELAGTLDQAPLRLVASIAGDAGGGLEARIEHADWQSAHAAGELRSAAPGSAPQGHVELHMARLADLDRLLGSALQGSLQASVDFDHRRGRSRANIMLDAKDVGVPAQQVRQLQLRGEIDSLSSQPRVALRLAAQLAINGVNANLTAAARGPLTQLQLSVHASSGATASNAAAGNVAASNVAANNSAVQLDATGTLAGSRSELKLSTLQAQYRQQTLRLLAPALISFGDGVAVDRLRLGVGQTVLQAEGRLTPALALRASVRNFTPTLLRLFVPTLTTEDILEAGGSIDLDADLHGAIDQPTGTLHLNARQLRAGGTAASGLPATDIEGTAQLMSQVAQVDVQVHAGSGSLQITGQAPLARSAPFGLKIGGSFNLNVVNPILEVSGRRLLGQARIDAELAGTLAAPQPRGTLVISNADLQDYPRGLHLTDISATLSADGQQLVLKQLSAHARSGTISASGTLGLGAGDLPMQLQLTARNAQPLASDLLTATIDMDLKVTGALRRRLDLAGTLHVDRAVINIPNALPPNIDVLYVVRPGEKPAAPPADSAIVVALDLTVDAPRAVFVRGRGLDAEVGGKLHAGGTSADPDISGGFDLNNGSFNLAGTRLTFTSGRVSFNGSGVKKKIDPTLDFTATDSGSGVTETLNVGGYADAPVISLTSTPEMPQDEILSRLLFGVSVTQLSTLQVAQIGAALVSMSGVGGGGLNPLTAVQRTLRLDRLQISGGTSGSAPANGSNASGAAADSSSGTTIIAGRYVTSRVYVGAKQNSNGPTQAQVQIDLTKRLKLQTTLGASGGSVQGATPQNDPGNSVGLSYQFEF